MNRHFRCLRIHGTAPSECCSYIELEKRGYFNKGFNVFYCSGSIISEFYDDEIGTTVTTLKDWFKKIGVESFRPPLLNNGELIFSNTVFLIGHKSKPTADFPENYVLAFGKSLRKELEKLSTEKSGYALYQASVYNLLREGYEKSPLYDASGSCYKEYLLWNDNGLWDTNDWDCLIEEQLNFNSAIRRDMETREANSSSTRNELAAEIAGLRLRLAWFGSGWLSSRLEDLSLENNAAEFCFYPPEIETWAKAALSCLLEYDAVLLAYFRKENSAKPPGWQESNNYIAILCDFLPYHLALGAKQESNDYLPTNSYCDHGGPRLWQGFMGPQMNMHTRHLILDGWLTLWPIGEKLYYQPASLALLYWAAKQADKPYTKTPKEFIENYDWKSSELWFGGNWRGQFA